MKDLLDVIEQKFYDLGIRLGMPIGEYCYRAEYYTHQYIEDDEGNILDYEDVITKRDLQRLSDNFGLEVDCLNW